MANSFKTIQLRVTYSGTGLVSRFFSATACPSAIPKSIIRTHVDVNVGEGLDRLAHLAVHVGLGLKPGQEIILTAPLESVPLVRKITEHAYKAGATLVTAFYVDSQDALTRFKYASDPSFDAAPQWLADSMAAAYRSKNVLRLSITGEDPSLLAGQDAGRVSRLNLARSKAYKEAMELVTNFTMNWTVISYATPAWAKAVFPGLPEDEAVAMLWQAIFAASRITSANPVADWNRHNQALHARTERLNAARYSALHFRGPGTDLRVGLADDHKWLGGGSLATEERPSCNPNIPSEEVFTTPHCGRVDGVATSTKPLSIQGTLIKGITMRFEKGRAVEISAAEGDEVLQKVLQTDEGAARLGEVALVPHSSPISKSKLLFQNTLFDENASCHIAMGRAYSVGISGGSKLSPNELAEKGANTSLIHIDWMIGSDEVDVDGIRADGTHEPVMRSGEWVPGEIEVEDKMNGPNRTVSSTPNPSESVKKVPRRMKF